MGTGREGKTVGEAGSRLPKRRTESFVRWLGEKPSPTGGRRARVFTCSRVGCGPMSLTCVSLCSPVGQIGGGDPERGPRMRWSRGAEMPPDVRCANQAVPSVAGVQSDPERWAWSCHQKRFSFDSHGSPGYPFLFQ